MELNELREVVKSVPSLYKLFKGCPPEILKYWVFREYRAGSFICNQGEQSHCLSIIISGYADVYYMNEKGNKYAEAVIEKGQFIGEFEIFDGKPHVCTVQAKTDLKLLQAKHSSFIDWLKVDNSICIYLIKDLCNRSYRFSHKAGNDTLYSLKTRLCSLLLSKSRNLPQKGQDIVIAINKEKLSAELAVTIRSVHRILEALKKKNIIEVKSGYILIKNLDKLAQEEKNSRYE